MRVLLGIVSNPVQHQLVQAELCTQAGRRTSEACRPMKLRNRPERERRREEGMQTQGEATCGPARARQTEATYTSLQLHTALIPAPHQPVHPSTPHQRTDACGGGQHD